MDGPFVNGDDEQLQFVSTNQNHEDYDDNVDDSGGGNGIRHSINDSSRDSSAGKLFVGGIAWETSEESFSNYFSNYGEITDSVIMMDKTTGRPRGFGFVTFANPADADKVLEQDHIIDGRQVEVKRTVPREDVQGGRVVSRTKKIFVGGIPLTLTEDDMREYFSNYGGIIEHQIMLDHVTGRSRGFGFVTFDSEEAVDKIFGDGQIHELGGKQVEVKRAEPKRGGGDFSYDNRSRRGGGGGGKSYGGGFGGRSGYGGGGYGGKADRGYDDYCGGYSGYDSYGGVYGGGSSGGFYPGFGGYGYGFGGAMYGGAGYAGGGYGGYGGGRGYGSGGAAGGSYGRAAGGGGGYGYGYGYDGGSKGYDNGNGSGGSSGGGRFHPYRK